jgi:hypothetical protein
MRAGTGNVEGDDRTRFQVGIEDRLPQRACARVAGIGDDEVTTAVTVTATVTSFVAPSSVTA